MKKNILTYIIGFIIAAWLLMGLIDFYKVNNYSQPEFCYKIEQEDGSEIYAGLGYYFYYTYETKENKDYNTTYYLTTYRGYILGFEVCSGTWGTMLL